MMIAVLVSESTAETGVASAVRVDVVVGVDVMMVMVDVMMVDIVVANMDGHLDVVRHWFLDGDRNVLLDVHWVWTIDGDLHWVGHWSIDGVGNVLLNGVGLWHWHLDWVWHRFLDMNGIWPIDWDLHFVGGSLLDDVWNGSVNWHWDCSRNGHLVWSVDWYGHLVGNLLLNSVGLGNRNFYLNWVRHMLDDLVRFWHSNFHLIRDFLDDLIGLWNTNLDFVRPIDGNMYGVRDLLLYGVRLWHMNWHFNVLLDRIRDVLHHLVGLRNRDLDWIGNMLLHSVWNVLLHCVRNWVSLQQGNCLLDIGMTAQIDTMTITAVMGVIVKNGFAVVVGSAVLSAAQIADVQSVDAVSVAQIEQTTFVELLLEWHCRFGFLFGVLLDRLGGNGRDQQECRYANLSRLEKI